MQHSQNVRRQAAQVRSQIFVPDEAPELLLNPDEILRRLDALTLIEREPVAPGHAALQNCFAVINTSYYSIFYRSDLPAWFQFICQAHEYAHYFLHAGESHCTEADINLQSNQADLPIGENRVAGYSGRERRECEANLFASELLLPSNLLENLFVENGWRARDFARISGLPFSLVCQQLAHALLVGSEIEPPNDKPVENSNRNSTIELDASQQRAAHSTAKRLLIEAGPGTGKTRTLTARVLHLLETGAPPESLLVLTFSNKAAEEMRERIYRAKPDAAANIWLGTFHAFGLEILRKFSAEAKLSADFKLLDPIDAGLLLEQNLLELELEHYQNLHQPTSNLKSILSVISRAKDELAEALDYQRAAEEMRRDAGGDLAKMLAAEKAQEIARVYRIYERLLREKDCLDLGDLVFHAVRLLQINRAVKQNLQIRFQHILVDEFQDVNRASSRLLGELTGENNNLWVVGDARQTIYRWRGASAANLRLFKTDFPDAETLSLEINYRSCKPVIELLNELAAHIEPNEEFRGWNAHRQKPSRAAISFTTADDLAGEAGFVAAQIRQKQLSGVPFKEQAILARTNNILHKFARDLIKHDIPVLYLGNLFERPETRDLLSLLALTTANNARHYLRLCQMPEYNLSLEDARLAISIAAERELEFAGALELAQTDARISAHGKEKFWLLSQQFADITTDTTAWQFFAAYLFDRSDFLRESLRDDSAAGRAKRFAIYQLLQFALGEAEKPARFTSSNPRESFLRFVRYLAASREETVFRRLPAWAENVDAVKLLTVHQAKGLEFPIVYLPHLGNRYYPNPRRGEVCSLPESLTADDTDQKSAHEQEEKCLFFVAVSRAKNELVLSCAAKYGDQTSKPSRFLELLKSTLPAPKLIDGISEAANGDGENLTDKLAHNRRLYSFYELELYLRCPRQYFYEQVLRTGGDSEAAIYLQFHLCVYQTIGWAKELKLANKNVEFEAAREKLNEIWSAQPISLHAYAAIYLSEAHRLVAAATELLNGLGGDFVQPQLEFALANGRVSLAADLLEQNRSARTVTARKIKTGRAPADFEWSEREKLQFSALQTALWANFPDYATDVSVNYLSGSRNLTFETTAKKVLTQTHKLETAIRGIETADFRPRPDPHKCSACAHYFLCPGEEK